MLEYASVLKILHNAKYDVKILARYGIAVAPIDDTMLMSYALSAGLHGHGMDALSERYLAHTPIPIKELIGSGKSQITFDRVPIDTAAPIRSSTIPQHWPIGPAKPWPPGSWPSPPRPRGWRK